MATFAAKKQRLGGSPAPGAGKLRLGKKSISNLFRYRARQGDQGNVVSLGEFNRVLSVDTRRHTLDVEGLTTYEDIVAATLASGLLPTVTPELRHITIGGATVGIGIESTCFRHGFVHDGLVEAEVLLPDRRIVTCTADNEHADLFNALPNSYGTLGYILRATIRLIPVRPFVHLRSERFTDLDHFLAAMAEATADAQIDGIEGLIFSADRMFLMTARFVDDPPRLDDILRKSIFYRLVQDRQDVFLHTEDYIFRYDPEWFWNIPDSLFYTLFRRYAPARFRNSRFYTRYSAAKAALWNALPWPTDPTEPLIQDWQVPWARAKELVGFALDNVDLQGKPWEAVPIETPRSPTLYPIRPDTLYFNLGSYTQVPRHPDKGDFHDTRIMDERCFELGGIKMLYSSSFLDQREFDRHYNGAGYASLKQRYDPEGRAYTLFEKCAAP